MTNLVLSQTTLLGNVSPGDIRGSLHIGGKTVESADGTRADIFNPATGEVLGSVAMATESDIDAAVKEAHRVFVDGEWSKKSFRDRARVLQRIAALIRENSEELGMLESLDTGKPLGISISVDVMSTAEEFDYVASLIFSASSDVRETNFHAHAFTRREAIGVVAAITPFNFPLILSSNKIAPALAMGNSIVHKPASDTPLSALYMADLFLQAGLPAGVVNIVTGSGSTIGDAIAEHPLVGKVAFTGSTAVGSHLSEVAGRALKPVTAELGGNGANLIFADADIESAVGAIVAGSMFNAGQFCMAGTRILVERPVYETLVEHVVRAVEAMKTGNPLETDTQMGPLVSERQLSKVSGMVDRAIAGGARVMTGGTRLDVNGGSFYAPTVVVDVSDQDEIVAEEVFGPVMTIQPFDSEDEAIARANGTPYGLAAGLQTKCISRAHRVSAALTAGMVWVNTWGLLDPAMPFGGTKQSGWGREYGVEGLRTYGQDKSVIFGL